MLSLLVHKAYMHCSVLMSAFGITPGSKSCNYNKVESRWEMEEAPLPSDAQLGDSSQSSGVETMQSDAAVPMVTEYRVASSGQESRAQSEVNEIPEIPLDPPLGVAQGMVVLSQGPVTRLTMWLPGRLRTTQPLPEKDMPPSLPSASEPRDSQLNDIQNDLPATGQDLPLRPGSNKSGGKVASSDADMRMQATVDGYPTSASLEESKNKRWGGRPETLFNMVKGDYKGLANVNNLNEAKQHGERFNHRKDQRDADASGSHPVMRSRVQFTKRVDGSQTLSYEEDVIKQKDKPKMRSLGKDYLVNGNRRALYTFLELLRNIRAE
ncbi:unnamed protein product [Lota lota]